MTILWVSRPQNYANGHKTSRTIEAWFPLDLSVMISSLFTELYQALLYREVTQGRVLINAGIAVETSVTVAHH